MSDKRSFFAELKRRNVYKVAVAYAVIAWLLIQIATQTFPFFEVPNWAVRLVILLIIAGFPIAVVCAWAYELTPEGLKKTEEVVPARSIARSTGRKLDFFIIFVLLVALGYFALDKFVLSPRRQALSLPNETKTVISAKSIAVLPFENLSDDKRNAYFAEGIQDEILTKLAGIADLKVISRTSTAKYQSKPDDLKTVSQQLGVANVVEGTVQKAADEVRVNVQLIDARTDSHLWAKSYDGKAKDVFAMESEVSQGIADALQAKLSPNETNTLASAPTRSPQAYDAYLRGLAYTRKAGAGSDAFNSQKYFREAVRLDPKFAIAWAQLSIGDSNGYISGGLPATPALREEAREAAETALTLQRNLGEAVLAKGSYAYGCLRDYDTAQRYFEQARQLLPNNSRIPESLAYVARRRGQWDLSVTYFNEAERLDPRNIGLLTQHAFTYAMLRRFSEAQRKFDQVLDIIPDDVDTLSRKARVAQAEGDLPRAAALLAPLHPNPDNPFNFWDVQAYQAILERRPAPVVARLPEILAKPDGPELVKAVGWLRFLLGWTQELAGDHAGAQDSWRQARSELEVQLQKTPGNYFLPGSLALTTAFLGDKAAALTLAERDMAANPIEKDPLTGPRSYEVFARVAAQTGEPDRAIAALQKLLSVPGPGFMAMARPLTPALLRLDPMFDPLRNDPRFQKLENQPLKPTK